MQGKLAIAQISTDPGQISQNTSKIIDTAVRARELGAELVVFPELTIPGYTAMDLLFNQSYIDQNLRAVDKVAAQSKGISVIVGFVDQDPNAAPRAGGRRRLYNSAAIIRDGQILGVQDKTLLPTHNVFFEERYFVQGRGQYVFDLGIGRIGVQICEDLWGQDYSFDVGAELASLGAELIVNLSASPFHLGKLAERTSLLSSSAKRLKLPFVYSNLVGSFDGFEGELVFDGRSLLISEQGECLAQGAAFEESLVIAAMSNGSSKQAYPQLAQDEELYLALVLGVRDYFRRLAITSGGSKPKAIIGLSGGIDSAVVAAIGRDALGTDNVIGVTLPSKFSSVETYSDAKLVADNLKIQILECPIQSQIDAVLSTLSAIPAVSHLPSGVAEENVQARLRMLDLMYFANKLGGVVLNTGNKTELALDNCTIYGDMVGGFSVLGDVDKDRVYTLARFINKRAGVPIIPLSVIDRVPTAELKPGQSDAMVMGAEPAVIAPLVRAIIECGLSFEEACLRFEGAENKGRFSRDLIRRTFARLDRSEWKRRQAAPAIRVTPVAFGNGRRFPMGHGFI